MIGVSRAIERQLDREAVRTYEERTMAIFWTRDDKGQLIASSGEEHDTAAEFAWHLGVARGIGRPAYVSVY